jgi:hypothetical protein
MSADFTIHNSPSEGREPTLQDVLFTIASLDFGLIAKIDSLNVRIDAMFRSILQREDNIDTRLRVIEQRVGKVEAKIEDIQDDLTSALAAVDQDSITLVSHSHRISKLETIIYA